MPVPAYTDRSEPEVAQAWVIIWAAEGPVKLPLRFLDRQVVDAGEPGAHQAAVVEAPVLVAEGAEPVAGVIVTLVREANGDAAATERPQLLDQPVVELSLAHLRCSSCTISARPVANSARFRQREFSVPRGELLRSLVTYGDRATAEV